MMPVGATWLIPAMIIDPISFTAKPPTSAKHTGTNMSASNTDNLLVKISTRKTAIVKKPKSESISAIAVADEDTVHLYSCGYETKYNLNDNGKCVFRIHYLFECLAKSFVSVCLIIKVICDSDLKI